MVTKQNGFDKAVSTDDDTEKNTNEVEIVGHGGMLAFERSAVDA